MACADVPVGQLAVAGGLHFQITAFPISADDKLVQLGIFRLLGADAVGVAEQRVVLAIVRNVNFRFGGEENPGAHVFQTADGHMADILFLEQVDDGFEIPLETLPTTHTPVGIAADAVDEAVVTARKVMRGRLCDVG